MRRGLVWASAIAIASLVAGCGNGGPSGGSSASGGSGDGPVTISMGITTTYYTFLPYYVAQGLGYFDDLKEQGIVVKEVPFQNGADEAKALVSGNLQMTSQMFNEMALPMSQGAPITFVMAYWNGGVTSMLSSSKYSATSLPELREELGRPLLVGVSALGAGTDVFARTQLAGAGLTPDDYEIVPLGSVDSYYPGLKTGKVDAVEASEPQAQKLIDQKIGKLLVNGWDPEVVHQMLGDFTSNGVAASNKFLESNPDAAKAVVASLVKADEWIKDHSDDPAAILDVLPDQAKKTIDATTNEEVWARIGAAISPDGCVRPGTGEGAEKALRASGLLDANVGAVDWSGYIDTSYLPATCS